MGLFQVLPWAVKDQNFRNLLILVVLLISAGTVFYHFVEGLHWFDAFYFTIISLTTVGYGDITPQTVLGKMFTIMYLIIGIGILVGFIDALFQKRLAFKQLGVAANKAVDQVLKK